MKQRAQWSYRTKTTTFIPLKFQPATTILIELPSSEPSSDENPETINWVKEVEIAIADLFEPTVPFQVLQQALNMEVPVAFMRGAEFRELKRFSNEHDPGHTFAGLKRAVTSQGRVIWTSAARVLATEEADKVANKTLAHIREKLRQTSP
ncbi:Aste57867_7384 [Aphanomyces stellatus]|uniref:Aste57867_6445 protein n=1 Tax=Aphanomyces stellatus TaxID=120398 RepID=A0A485KI90_9STRA|nr:hypothetical protein As57867_007358 [Aphanomyces stellatus]KAF0708123.1 hypothetical protein As57867_006429 [Aphanomyces stellatus]VFT83437.1 Aste57867_6445 [Aphanomyces stellatus]VFT84300.1 Aste57867_7384 [Aphanomyces stellatus]